MANIKRILDDNRVGNAGKSQWLNYWQDLADVLLPRRADITIGTINGGDRQSIIYDGSPMRARRGLANSIDSIMKARTKKWFHMKAREDDLNDLEDVRRWFSKVENLMWNQIYSRHSRFVQRSGEVDNDLAALGTGCLFIGESYRLNNLVFRSIHPKDIVIFENADGVVDKIHIHQFLTTRQALQAYGEDNLSDRIKERSRSSSGERSEFIICVQPRHDRRVGSLRAVDLPFEMAVIEREAEKLVLESGYHEFPYAVPRWETASGEVYGRSPGMVALPDAKTLQAMGKTILIAGQKAVDPPLMVIDDAIIGAAKTFPGGITTIDAEASRSFNGLPMQPMQFGKNIPLGIEMMNEKRQAVEASFFRNIFSLPIDGPQMTATEIIQRKEEYVREIGPVFGQLESEYTAPIVERVFGIMLRAGAFPEPPEVLTNQQVDFEFESPIQRMARQIEAAAASNAINTLAPFVEADPSMMDNFDGDAIARSTPETFGVPMNWIRPLEERDGIRRQRTEAQQNADQMKQQMMQAEAIGAVGA